MEPQKTTPSEKPLLTLQPAWRSYFVFYVAILIFGLGPIINPEVELNQSLGLVIAGLLLVFVVFRRKTTSYRITKEDVRRETRIGGQVFNKSLPLESVAGLEVRRGVVHRLLGIGHLQFRPLAGTHPDFWWYGVEDPFAVKNQIDQILKRARQETGVKG
jgi:uncharacterized membrane protein YdbT with pleckstrin-like domain